MHSGRISLTRTVYYNSETEEFCQCAGKFWKTCSLRVINNLPCQESIISVTPIRRGEVDPAAAGTRSLDKALTNLEDGLRSLEDKLKLY